MGLKSKLCHKSVVEHRKTQKFCLYFCSLKNYYRTSPKTLVENQVSICLLLVNRENYIHRVNIA